MRVAAVVAAVANAGCPRALGTMKTARASDRYGCIDFAGAAFSRSTDSTHRCAVELDSDRLLVAEGETVPACLLYTSPSPRD